MGSVVHDGLVNPLSGDYRTAGLCGPKPALKRAAENILTDLAHDEVASWAILSAGLTPRAVVLTDRRLLTYDIGSYRPCTTLSMPYQVDVGKKKLLGQEVTVRDTGGNQITLLLQPADLDSVRAHAVLTPRGSNTSPNNPASNPSPADGASRGATSSPGPGPMPGTRPSGESTPPGRTPGAQGVPGAPGAWRWGHPVLSSAGAERLAADHMTYLGYAGAAVTPPGPDGGLDAVAVGAAAQVKFHAVPTGSADIQRLYGAAADFKDRLFYATAYTAQAVAVADQRSIALFQFDSDGLVVAVNDTAHALSRRGHTPPAPRDLLGRLTFEARQNRAVEWARQIEAATRTPISDRKRKGAKQLAQRQSALALLNHGLAQLADTDNPLYKKGRKERTLTEAEKTLKSAALLLGLRLR